MAPRKRLKVDIFATPDTFGSILYGLYDALSTPGVVWPRLILGEPGEPLADVRIVAKTGAPFTCRGGTPVSPHAAISEANDADVICIPNVSLPIDGPPHDFFITEVDWLRRRYSEGATIASVCSGAILLAATRLLDGSQATTHWGYDDFFRRNFPEIEFRPERILTFAGEGDRLIIAGGMGSWQDLALYIIARFLGAEHAVRTAKIHVFSEHVEGQLPYAALSRRIQKDDPIIAECQVWAATNYAKTHPVNRMLDMTGLPQRSFNRRFNAATGFRPMEYIHALRIEEAKQMLEGSTNSIDEIAAEVGYEDPRSFRRVFSRRTGLSPSAYRTRFSHARFLAPRS